MLSDDSWRDSYDSWKLATPPEYDWLDGEEDGEPYCEDCGNVGWVADGDMIVPCACQPTRTLDDLDDESWARLGWR